MRLNLSPLHEDLFLHNLLDTPYCPNCANEYETTAHFLLHCPNYQSIREDFLSDVNHLVRDTCAANMFAIDLYPFINSQIVSLDASLLDLFLHGFGFFVRFLKPGTGFNRILLNKFNLCLHYCIRSYVSESKRFAHLFD